MGDLKFSDYCRGVTPLPKKDLHPDFFRPSRRFQLRKYRHRDPVTLRPTQSIAHNFDAVPESLFWALRNNRLPESCEIDLHGCFVDDALRRLDGRLLCRKNRTLQCWRVVYGKGRHSPNYDRAPLKYAVIEYLLNQSSIAALAESYDQDGDSGSCLILVHARP